MKIKKFIFSFFVIVGLNNVLFASNVKYKVDYDYLVNNIKSYEKYGSIKRIIIDNCIKNNFNNEYFYIKIKVFISSNGNMRYIFLNQSQEGYNNKILIMNKLEELKKIGFRESMKDIQDYYDYLKYKEYSFIFEIGELKEGY